MATLTVDRRAGKVVGYNIQWCENRRRYTIYLSSQTYRRKTVEGFKDLVETLGRVDTNFDTAPPHITGFR